MYKQLEKISALERLQQYIQFLKYRDTYTDEQKEALDATFEEDS